MPDVPIHHPEPGIPAISVQIPTRGRPGLLAAAVGALAAQDVRGGLRFEVIVGLDGAQAEAESAARRAWDAAGGDGRATLRVVEFPREGHLPIRRAMVSMTDAPLVLFMNDDVVADAGLVAAHVAAHAEAAARCATGRGAVDGGVGGLAYPHGVMVVGDSPWAEVDAACAAAGDGETVLDRMVRETALIFFFDSLRAGAGERWRDWGFRHFWTLNASAPRRAVEAVGGVRAIPETYGHEDIELAFRLHERLGMPVLFRLEARGVHRHRYGAADVMRREEALGAASWRFARANPAFGAALFGRDVASESELAYSREFVERERRDAERLRADFEALGRMEAGGAGVSEALLGVLSRQFVLLKRWLWRKGLVEAAAAEAAAGWRGDTAAIEAGGATPGAGRVERAAVGS